MARAIIPAFAEVFGLPDIKDDTTNGWQARFQVVYTGTGASGGFMREEFEVHFLDSDLAVSMDNKIRDACRNRAEALGIPSAQTMVVISMIPPRRL